MVDKDTLKFLSIVQEIQEMLKHGIRKKSECKTEDDLMCLVYNEDTAERFYLPGYSEEDEIPNYVTEYEIVDTIEVCDINELHSFVHNFDSRHELTQSGCRYMVRLVREEITDWNTDDWIVTLTPLYWDKINAKNKFQRAAAEKERHWRVVVTADRWYYDDSFFIGTIDYV